MSVAYMMLIVIHANLMFYLKIERLEGKKTTQKRIE